MSPNDYIGRPILDLLTYFKSLAPLVEYTKIEDDEFLKLPELGVYFQAGSNGTVLAYRVYHQSVGEYYPASPETRNACFGIQSLDDAVRLFGPPIRVIPSVSIPGVAATSPGQMFNAGNNRVVSVYHDADSIRYVQVKITA